MADGQFEKEHDEVKAHVALLAIVITPMFRSKKLAATVLAALATTLESSLEKELGIDRYQKYRARRARHLGRWEASLEPLMDKIAEKEAAAKAADENGAL